MDDKWIQELEQIIREKMGSDALNSGELAELLLMSRTQFFNKVKTLTGQTPVVLVPTCVWNMRINCWWQNQIYRFGK